METADIAPRASTTGTVGVGLDARVPAATVPFDIADGTSYSGATSMGVFDSLGREHGLGLYFRKTADNAWEVHGSVDGTALAAPLGNLNFNTDGTLNAATSTIPMNVAVPAGFSVGADGTILSRYTNGETTARGKIALANFANPQGLQSQGGNQWAETADSGAALLGAPGSGTLGTLQSGALESSNVDLTAELVNMIMAQRVYQANAQTIKTNDQLLQTIVNLR